MNKDTILLIIAGHLEEMIDDLSADEVKETSRLCLLGASSVDRAELIERMREDLRLKADRSDFNSANNLGDLAKMLASSYKKERSVIGHTSSGVNSGESDFE